MNKVEILGAEIKSKIILIQKRLFESRSTEIGIGENIPKYHDTITTLEKENAELKAERDKIGNEHSEDLKQIDKLVNELSKLVEIDNA
ncbi:MAG: hypothetical protein P8M50_06005 [Paracoccaceae bacterium]|nr:hypothetical protein [Paracoccaceae bacterium]